MQGLGHPDRHGHRLRRGRAGDHRFPPAQRPADLPADLGRGGRSAGDQHHRRLLLLGHPGRSAAAGAAFPWRSTFPGPEVPPVLRDQARCGLGDPAAARDHHLGARACIRHPRHRGRRAAGLRRPGDPVPGQRRPGRPAPAWPRSSSTGSARFPQASPFLSSLSSPPVWPSVAGTASARHSPIPWPSASSWPWSSANRPASWAPPGCSPRPPGHGWTVLQVDRRVRRVRSSRASASRFRCSWRS